MKFPCRFLQYSALFLICGIFPLSLFAADEYLVIDVSAGFDTNSYPVTYYDEGALPGSVTDDTYKTDKILLKKMPAGTFVMGSSTNEAGRTDNEDLHQVTLTQDYYLGVYETTEYQWFKMTAVPGSAKTPVYGKNYNDNIVLAINMLNTKTELGELEVALPTEAQWEYACRAGTQTSYSFGSDAAQLGNYAWYEANSGSFIKFPGDVGSKLPNPWGLYDMHGNVREYCSDVYNIHLGSSAVTNPVYTTGTGFRVAKGGGYDSFASACRSASRVNMDEGGSKTGFRLCIALPPPPPTFELSVVNGSGDGSYTNGHVQTIVADAPPAWFEFDKWSGATNTVADIFAASTTLSIPASNITVTATYKAQSFDVTVSNGTASAYSATNGQVVVVTADPPAVATNVFWRWEGDVANVADISAMTTTVTIAGADVVLSAAYRAAPYYLTVNDGTGDGYHFEGEVVTVTAPAPGATHTFWWEGDTHLVTDPEAWNTTFTMPARDAEISATYPEIKYTLTVVNGNGSGSYTTGTRVNVSPKTAPSDMHEFDQWAGDTPGLDSFIAESTVFTIGEADALIEPHYKPVSAVEGDYMVVTLSGSPYEISYMDSVPGGVWDDTYKGNKMAFRRIMPGTYQMGAGTAAGIDEHTVTLTEAFYIGVFEVTQNQWYKLMSGSGSSYLPMANISYDDIRGDVNGRDWSADADVDADSYVGVMRTMTGSDAFDLPTEAQWEYACRAGSTGDFYGSPLTDIAYYSANSGGSTWAVGLKAPNSWGLYDMHGNVLEFCLDWFYATGLGTAPQTDPLGPTSPSTGLNAYKRVRRGGAYDMVSDYCKAGVRSGLITNSGAANTGFRMAMAAGVPHTLTVVDCKVHDELPHYYYYRAKIAISADEVENQTFDYWKVEPAGTFAGPLFNAEDRDTIISMPKADITVSAQYK